MKIFKTLFACMIAVLAMSSCTKDSLTVTVKHDIQLPAPLLEIADATVTYTDQDGVHTEAMPNGKFYHTSLYYWDDEKEIEKGVYDKFDDVYITLKLKVPVSELKEGARLLDDPSAYFYFDFKAVRETETHSENRTQTITDNKKYTFGEEAQEYAYSVNSQINLFKHLETSPFYDLSFSRTGMDFTYDVTFDFRTDSEGGLTTKSEIIK